jgi:glucose/arabinose dehydrogenase
LRRAVALALLAALLAVPAALAHASSRRATVQFQTIAHVGAGALFVAVAPGAPGTLYVVRQPGQIAAVTGSKVRLFANISKRVGADASERGLLSMAFSPGYRKNHLVYLSYTDPNGDSRVVRYRTNGRTLLPSTAKTLLFVKQPFANHNGGQLQFGPDGKLYVGYGDGGSGGDPGNRAQNPGTKLGKLLRLDVTKAKPVWQMVALGLRNPWRFSFDRTTGDLWVGDVGQDTWEEIDYVPHAQVKPLLNFGWSVYEGDAKFKDAAVGAGALIKPVYVYKHGSSGCSVTGGYLYRGSAVPSLKGRYVFGDFCSGLIWSGVIGGAALTDVRQEGKVSQPAGFGEDASGELYIAALDGAVYKLAQA